MALSSTPETEAVREQARQLLIRLAILKPDAFPHQPAPWTVDEVGHLEKLAKSALLQKTAETAAFVLRELARVVTRLTPYPPPASLPTPATSPHNFNEY